MAHPWSIGTCLLFSLALPSLEHIFLSYLIVQDGCQDHFIWLCSLFTTKAPCQEMRFTKWSIYPVEELSLIHLQGLMLLSIRDTMSIGIPTISFIFLAGQNYPQFISDCSIFNWNTISQLPKRKPRYRCSMYIIHHLSGDWMVAVSKEIESKHCIEFHN